jgi:predicted dehydrogenase
MTGWLDSSWSVDHHRMLETSFQIHGENGSLSVNDDILKLYLRTERGGFPRGWTLQTKPELFSGVDIDIGGPQFTRQDVAFFNAIIYGNATENDLKSAYAVQNVVDCIYKSAKSDGHPVLI